MAAKILTKYKQKIAGLELQPAAGGCFELIANDELIYSKLKTGQFPDEDQMVTQIGKRLAA